MAAAEAAALAAPAASPAAAASVSDSHASHVDPALRVSMIDLI